MDAVTPFFPLEQIISDLGSFWGDRALKGTLLPTGKYLVSIDAEYLDLLADFLHEVLTLNLSVQLREYDTRCNTLFFLVSLPVSHGVPQ